MTNNSSIFIFDNINGKSIQPEISNKITDKNISDWKNKWLPDFEKRIVQLDKSIRNERKWLFKDWTAALYNHDGWDKKTEILRKYPATSIGFTISVDGMTQAMMAVALPVKARLPESKEKFLIYVDFIESAPWNRRDLVGENVTCIRKFKGCGLALIKIAGQQSVLKGFEGRLALHSENHITELYKKHCCMTNLGIDQNHPKKLNYFEFTSKDAKEFLIAK